MTNKLQNMTFPLKRLVIAHMWKIIFGVLHKVQSFACSKKYFLNIFLW